MKRQKTWPDDTKLSGLARQVAAKTGQSWQLIATAVEMSLEYDSPIRVGGKMVPPSTLYREGAEECEKRGAVLRALLGGE